MADRWVVGVAVSGPRPDIEVLAERLGTFNPSVLSGGERDALMALRVEAASVQDARGFAERAVRSEQREDRVASLEWRITNVCPVDN